MNRSTCAAVVLLLVAPLVAPTLPAASTTDIAAAEFVIGYHHDLPRVGDGVPGAEVTEVLPSLGAVVVSAHDAAALTAWAGDDPRIRYVEPVVARHLLFDVDARYTPTDPLYVEQYGPGQVRADEAWDTTRGDTDAAVCVVDTGARVTHVDLSGSRYRGGIDLVDDDADPADGHGHGTHVAGIAVATMDNAAAIAGIAQVAYYVVRVLDDNGDGTFADVAAGITWCADRPDARLVINLSLGCDGGGRDMPTPNHGTGESCDSQVVRDAVDHATAKGRLVVAAAGNAGPCYECIGFPASLADVVAVGCTYEGSGACFYGSGGRGLALAAPGNAIVSTWASGDADTASLSGTSMSSPHVAGAAALYWSHDTTIDRADLAARLIASARDLGDAGHDSTFGCGELDVVALFQGTGTCTIPPVPPCDGTPANDCMDAPVAITTPDGTITQSTAEAHDEEGEFLPCDMGNTIWFEFTPIADGNAYLEVTQSDHWAVIAAYEVAADGGLDIIGCQDIYPEPDGPWLTIPCVAGKTYRIQAGGYYGERGTLQMVHHLCQLYDEPPAAPEGLAAAHGIARGDIDLTWEPPSTDGGPDVTAYHLERSTTCESPWTPVASTDGATPSHVDAGLAEGVGQCYRVRAENAVGTGPWSNLAYSTPLGVPAGPAAVAVPEPGAITVAWYRVPDSRDGGASIEAYHVYGADAADGPFVLLATVSSETFKVAEEDLPPGTTRHYRVSAENAYGEGPPTEVSARTPTAPDAPRNVLVRPAFPYTALQVTWSAPADDGGSALTGYRVYRATDSGGPFQHVASVGANVHSWRDGGTVAYRSYHYQVTAVNAVGEGPTSAVSCGSTVPLVPALVTSGC